MLYWTTLLALFSARFIIAGSLLFTCRIRRCGFLVAEGRSFW